MQKIISNAQLEQQCTMSILKREERPLPTPEQAGVSVTATEADIEVVMQEEKAVH